VRASTIHSALGLVLSLLLVNCHLTAPYGPSSKGPLVDSGADSALDGTVDGKIFDLSSEPGADMLAVDAPLDAPPPNDGNNDFPPSIGPELVVNGKVYVRKGSQEVFTWERRPAWDLPQGNGKAAFGDLDSDGDLDFFFGQRGQGTPIVAYENNGSFTAPAWLRRRTWDPPMATNEINYLGYTTPALADLDADGDLDLLYGAQYGGPIAYKNVGDETTASWQREVAWDLLGAGANQVCVTIGDLDGDGDLDALVDIVYSPAKRYRNDGSINAPIWVGTTDWPVAKVGTWEFRSTLADIDGDGDLDLIYGNRAGSVVAFRNEGDVNTPQWVRYASWDAPSETTAANPTLVDLDGH